MRSILSIAIIMTYLANALAWANPPLASPITTSQGGALAQISNNTNSGVPIAQTVPTAVKKKKRVRQHPELLNLAGLKYLECCNNLCGVRFGPGGEWNGRTASLEAEQQRLSSLQSYKDRKKFVALHVPIAHEHGRRRGKAMTAAGQYVCAKFFTQVFGVSNKLIYSCKQLKADSLYAGSSTDR